MKFRQNVFGKIHFIYCFKFANLSDLLRVIKYGSGVYEYSVLFNDFNPGEFIIYNACFVKKTVLETT